MNRRKVTQVASVALFFSRVSTQGFAVLLVGLMLVVAGCGESGPGVEVDSFTPSGEVLRTTNLTVAFSDDVVGDSLLSVPLADAPIEFSPSIPGQFQWIASDKLRFYPDVMLAPSTEYTADVLPEATRRHGYALRGERSFTFQTPRLQVSSAYLTFEYEPGTTRQADLAGTIEFNYEVTPQEARNSVSVRYADGTPIPFQVTTTEPSTVIALEASGVQRGDDERTIELRIDEGLMCVGGQLGLAEAYTKPATLPGQNNLNVEQVAAVRTSPSSQYVRLEFNMPVQVEGAASYLSVQPEIEVQVDGSHNQIRLWGNFAADQAYQVVVRKGLLAIDGSQMARPFTGAVTFRQEDIPPQISFVGQGYYLTRSGHLNLGLSTVNVGKVDIEVDRIYANNLVQVLNAYDLTGSEGYYRYNAELDQLGQRVHSDALTVPVERNEEVVTPIPMRDYLWGERQGLFRVTARESDRRWRSAARWVVATDLGLIAKKAGGDLWVWVNSLSTMEPVSNARLALYSQNNQELMRAVSDEEGIAVFEDYRRFTDTFTPFVVTAERGQDVSFIELTRRQLSTSDFEVGGQPYLQHGYEAFLYNERGVYRPGEAAHLGAIVRGPSASVPASFPVHLRVTGPDGQILSEQRARLNEQGGTAFTLDVPDYALTGRYTAALMLGNDEEIGRTTFNVEEFVPDRMKVNLSLGATTYRPGERMGIDVEGITLFGPPAAGRRVQTIVEIEPYAFSPTRYSSFTFGDPEQSFTPVQADLEEQKLDDDGRVTLNYTVPMDLKPPSALRAVIEATVLEPGGRGVTAYQAAVVHPYETYVGLRGPGEGYAEPGQDYPVEFVVVDPDAQPVAGREVEVSLYHVTWHSIWRQGDDGQYRYESEQMETLEQRQIVASTGSPQRFTVTPERYGSYRLVARDRSSGAQTVLSFYSGGWGFAAWSMDTADRVELELDQETYEPGETAEVLVRAPFSGRLLLTVERQQVLDHQVVKLEENTATVEVPITAAYKPNVYVSAHLIRTMEGLERNEAARAFGVAPLRVRAEANRLDVALSAPEEMRPQGPLTVDVQVRGAQGTPYITLAAVDEGITQLTDFQTPDPHGFFFGKRRLEVETHDLYGVLLPEVASSLSSPAGDVEAARKRRVNPVTARRVKPVAFWSGPLETDRQGRAQLTFDIPQFNGTVRLMAIAYAGDRFGSAEQQVLVRDPIVMTPTFPRFIGGGDTVTVPVGLFNGTGQDADFDVRLQAEGPVQLQDAPMQSVRIPAGREGQVYFNVTAGRTMGTAAFTLAAQGGGQQTEDEVEVPVRPPVPFTTLAGSGSVEAGQTAQFTFPGDFLPETGEYTLTLSSFPAIRFAGSLQYLLQYPHGCIEQTTSRLFPLLAFNDLTRVVAPELFERNSADYYLEEGIAKLERMQLPSGSFAYWPGGDYANTWSSVYASHFLIEARKAGYVVADRVYDRMLDAVRAIARDYRSGDPASLEQSAYAVYVLALAGAPERSIQNYLKNNALEQMPTFSRYQLAGAFALTGALTTARGLLPQTATPPVTIQTRETGGNFNSDIRSRAIMLDVLAEVDPASPQVPHLVESLSRSVEAGRWYTTQENAYAFLALGKILRTQAGADYTGTLLVDGQAVETFGVRHHRFTSDAWGGQGVTLQVDGTGTCYYYWQAAGLPSGLHVDEYDRDLVVRRRFLTDDGGVITNHNTFRQGDLIIAELSLRAPQDAIDNVAVTDLLPAGFEIENPRLQSRRGIDWIADEAYQPDHMDLRDDRLILYGDLPAGEEQTFYYGLRVVSEGAFTLPPVRAEAMYAPMKASVASSGRVTVRSAGE